MAAGKRGKPGDKIVQLKLFTADELPEPEPVEEQAIPAQPVQPPFVAEPEPERKTGSREEKLKEAKQKAAKEAALAALRRARGLQ